MPAENCKHCCAAMATNPENPPPSGRPAGSASWSGRIRLAREAEPPAVDVRARVAAAIAHDRSGPAAEDIWSAFAAIFAGPRVLIPGATCALLGAPCALWLLVTELGRLDAWMRFMVIGGLPPWLVALVT